jgi:hypothetical protein
VGLLTQADLKRLGSGFDRYFSIPEDPGDFADLLLKLNDLPPVPDAADEEQDDRPP